MRAFLQSDTFFVLKMCKFPKNFPKTSGTIEQFWAENKTISGFIDRYSRRMTMGFESGRVLNSAMLTTIRSGCSYLVSIREKKRNDVRVCILQLLT